MHMLEQSHKKRGWSLSPGLHVALRKDTPGELSLELSLKTLKRVCQVVCARENISGRRKN